MSSGWGAAGWFTTLRHRQLLAQWRRKRLAATCVDALHHAATPAMLACTGKHHAMPAPASPSVHSLKSPGLAPTRQGHG